MSECNRDIKDFEPSMLCFVTGGTGAKLITWLLHSFLIVFCACVLRTEAEIILYESTIKPIGMTTQLRADMLSIRNELDHHEKYIHDVHELKV